MTRRFLPGRLNAVTVTLLYALFASLWIVSSGFMLSLIGIDQQLQGRLELLKGLVFVAVSSVLLYVLLKRRWYRSVNTRTSRPETRPEQAHLILFFILLSLFLPLAGLIIFEIYPGDNQVYNIFSSTGTVLLLLSLSLFSLFTATFAGIVLLWRQQRRQIEEMSLQAGNRRYRMIVEILPDMIFLNRGDSIEFINQAGLDLLGADSPDQVIGHSPLEFFHDDYYELARDRIRQALQRSGTLPTVETRLIALNGTEIDIEVTAVSFMDMGSMLIQVVCHDIRKRKESERELLTLNRELEHRVADRTASLARTNAQLQFTNKELESYSYSVSHDLRAPLRAISGFSEILKRRHGDSLAADAQHYLDNIIEAGARMERLIDDLLNYSRIGHRSVTIQKVSLSRVLEEVCDDLAASIKQAGIHLTVPAADELPLIYCNKTLLHQIFINL
ncbi:MAG: histidine kinase dimerization/phospho-acceptor domain-containing protein, partial [Gammaproteobacteria bacterium]